MTLNDASALVKDWWRCENLVQFCECTHMDRRTASNWAANMRRRGVALKAMSHGPGGGSVSVSELSGADYEQLALLSNKLQEQYEKAAELQDIAAVQAPEVVDVEEQQRRERIEASERDGDKRRAKTREASQYSKAV